MTRPTTLFERMSAPAPKAPVANDTRDPDRPLVGDECPCVSCRSDLAGIAPCRNLERKLK